MEFLMSDCDIELVQVSCTNQDCPNLIWITKKQKRKIYLESFLRYGRLESLLGSTDSGYNPDERGIEELSEAPFLPSQKP